MTILTALAPSSASASKEAVAVFGSFGAAGEEFSGPGDVAVNATGAGPAGLGEVYVVDEGNKRIQRFALQDGDTSDPYDDSYLFVSAWGADVDSSTAEMGYEVCTVAAQCKTAIVSGGEGALSNPGGVAVDEDTGQVYVADSANFRVNVYEGDGTFLRSFGWDVVASGPGDQGAGYEVCIAAADVCKAGLQGAGVGQLGAGRGVAVSPADGNASSGTVFVADEQNRRVATYALNGGTPSSFGSPPDLGLVRQVSVDSRGIVYMTGVGEGQGIARYDSQNANGSGVGFLRPISAAEPVMVSRSSSAYLAGFQGMLADTDVGQITVSDGTTPLSGGNGLNVLSIRQGSASPPEDSKQALIVNATAGQFKVEVTTSRLCGTLTSGSTTVTDVANCPNADFSYGSINVGDALTLGGGVGGNTGLPPGTTATAVGPGTVTLSNAATESGLRGLIATETTTNVAYNALADSLQSALTALPGIEPADVSVAGGPGSANPYQISFAGTFSARQELPLVRAIPGSTPLGGGTHSSSFTLTPGGSGDDEQQGIAINATAGVFRLTFEGQTTADLPFNASASQVVAALRSLSSMPRPALPPSNNVGTAGIEVDPDSDGPGPDADLLYVLRTVFSGGTRHSVIYQFGPTHAPGLVSPPATFEDTHGSLVDFTETGGLGLNALRDRLFVTSSSGIGGSEKSNGAGAVYALDQAGGVPTASLDSISNVTATTATLNATIDPNGGPPVRYRIEYSTDGVEWASTPDALVGTQESPQAIEAVLKPLPGGLKPGRFYQVRIVATKAFTLPVVSGELTFTTLPSPPIAETVGSPVRTGTSVRFDGRLDPRGQATTYHFEYGTQGPCDVNTCQASVPLTAGSTDLIELVSQQVEDLQPATTYHYRLIAENGTGTVAGEDMVVNTRASNAPLSHGHFPGPVGSDRAWEQVNLADTGANPVVGGLSFSDDGNRAVYQIPGGTPITDSGSTFGIYFAERMANGWNSRSILPNRNDVAGPNWRPPVGSDDLSEMASTNLNVTTGVAGLWRLRPTGIPLKLRDYPSGGGGVTAVTSEDGSRVVTEDNTPYDVSTGVPQPLGLMPGGGVPSCGASGVGTGRRSERTLSADGTRFVFTTKGEDCSSVAQIYQRDIPAEETTRVTPPPLSGQACTPRFIKQSPDAVFFFTSSRLAAGDTIPTSCTGALNGDVYRYGIETGAVSCVTCVPSSLHADVAVSPGTQSPFGAYIAVAEDGSRVYFVSPNQLLPGTSSPGIYRVHVATGNLAYVGSLGADEAIGDSVEASEAINPEGSVLIFRSSNAGLNQRNGGQNGGTRQYYRYDDRDRSLVCVSCPPDGSPAAQEASSNLTTATFRPEAGPNADPLDDAGNTFAFATPNALVGADQNTPSGGNPVLGTDVYEWRDGRVLLVSDGLTSWPQVGIVPNVNGVSPSGRDIFFTASAQYTPDAIDGYNRLYDARIGGGIEFPPPPKPCPLEVCQGTPKGAPEEAPPGSNSLQGPGNAGSSPIRARCPKGKIRRRSHCVPKPHKKKKHRKASTGRRTAR